MLWALLAFLYVNTGFQLGKKAVKTWKKRDSKSLESFLLFPVSHARGKVGAPLAILGGINGDHTTFFRVLITLGWPVMVAWNVVLVLGLLGPDKIFRRLMAGKPSFEQTIKRIRAEERKVDRMLLQLQSGEGNEKRSRRKKAPAALAAAPPPAEAPPAQTGVSLDLLEAATPPGLYTPPPTVEPPPSQVQVRVTVDVTAPGPATDEADKGDEKTEARDAPANAAGARLVH